MRALAFGFAGVLLGMYLAGSFRDVGTFVGHLLLMFFGTGALAICITELLLKPIRQENRFAAYCIAFLSLFFAASFVAMALGMSVPLGDRPVEIQTLYADLPSSLSWLNGIEFRGIALLFSPLMLAIRVVLGQPNDRAL